MTGEQGVTWHFCKDSEEQQGKWHPCKQWRYGQKSQTSTLSCSWGAPVTTITSTRKTTNPKELSAILRGPFQDAMGMSQNPCPLPKPWFPHSLGNVWKIFTSYSSSASLFFFFKITLFWNVKQQRPQREWQTDGKKRSSIPWFTALMVTRPGLGRLKSGTRNSTWTSQMDGRMPSTWAIFCHLPRRH